MDSTSQQLLQGASGAGGDEKPMLENMFRINTYKGDENDDIIDIDEEINKNQNNVKLDIYPIHIKNGKRSVML